VGTVKLDAVKLKPLNGLCAKEKIMRKIRRLPQRQMYCKVMSGAGAGLGGERGDGGGLIIPVILTVIIIISIIFILIKL